MRLSKFSKKMIAFVCAIALVVTGLVFVPSKDAAAEDYSNLEYKVSDNNPDLAVAFVTQGGVTTSQEVNYCLDQGTNFYCATTAAFTKPDFKTVTCNGNVEDPARAGANFWIPMSVLNDNAYNVVTIEDAVGNTSQFVVRKGTPETPTAESTEAPSVDPSTQAPTEGPTEESTEAPSTDWISAKNQWVLRKDDGSFDVIADGGATYDGFDGIASFYSGSWGGGDVDVKTPASTDPNKLDIRVNSVGTEDWSMQVHINKTGLDATKAYSVTLTAGETTLLEETVSEISTYAKTVNLANKLAVGETTLVLDIEEQTMPPAPVVQDITINPNTAQIEANRNIWASWTNPTDTTKAYAYLKQADAGYDVIAANGWDFNTQATQPMTSVDNVDHSKNNEVKVEEGGTYVFIVDTYDAWNRPTGHGEIEITIPSLTPEEKEAKEYLEKINTEENLALHKTPIVASHDNDGKNIVDGNNGSRWQADKTVDNTSFAVDLESVVTVDKVLVSWEASNARAYEIYLAGEDQEYGTTPVATVTGLPNDTAVYRLSKDIDTEARYVKVVVTEWSTNAENYGISPYELAVFGKETPTESTSEQPTSEQPSTEAPTQEPGVMTALTPENFVVTEEVVEEGQITGRWFQVSGYEAYIGYWNNSSGQAMVFADDQDHIQAQQLSSNWWGEWAFQIRKTVTGLKAGEEYTLTINMNASEANGTYCTSSDPTLVPVQAGDQTITIKGTADDNGTVKFNVGAGYVGTAVVMDYSNPVVKDSSGTQVYPAVEPTTEAPTETSTEAPTETQTAEPTTQAPTQKPTQAPTTIAPTKLPDPVPVIKIPDKAKVKKAVKKKKSAKKIKVKIKKVKGSKGYQVAVYKTKKNAKKNKKALVKKFTKKLKLTIKSKKFKKKKKLYVKVRAFTLDGTVKVYGAWSKPKKTTKK